MTPADTNESKRFIADLIVDVPDYPKEGVVFKDVTPLLASPGGFSAAIVEMVKTAVEDVDYIVGMEARGFIFAAPMALAVGAGFVPVRKPNKLPREVVSQTFDLEYGTDTLEIHADAIPSGAKVLIVDDVLATGGTILATKRLLDEMGADVVGVTVLMELGFLGGREKLTAAGLDKVTSVLQV